MRILVAILAMAVLLSGCHDEKKKANRDDSLMTVSGHVLTKEKADRMLAAQLAVARGKKRAQNGLVNSIDKKFLMDCLLGDYAKENGIKADEKDVNRRVSRLVSRHAGMSTNLVEELREMVRSELTMRKVHNDFVARQKVEVPQSEVKRRRELLERINRDAGITNAAIRATAQQCWKQIVTGKLTFQQAVEQYDQTEGGSATDGSWGEFSLDAFSDEETLLREMLPKMNPGDITQPVPGDNGLVIVKLLGTGVNMNSPQSSVPIMTYRLARIFFHLYETWDPQSDADLEQELKSIELRERWNAFVGELTKKAVITCTDGGKNLETWKSNNAPRKENKR